MAEPGWVRVNIRQIASQTKKSPFKALCGVGGGGGMGNYREWLSEPIRGSERYFFATPKTA